MSVKEIESVLRPKTKLMSIMYANNKIGTIQPISKIGELLCSRGILFHTDAVQAMGHILVNVEELQVDFWTAGKYRYMIACERYRIVYQIVEQVGFFDDIQDCRQSNDSSILSK